MTDDISPLPTGSESPFDAIRRATPEGREYWSGRDLQPLLGYSVWRDFANAIERARIAAINSGQDVTSNFAGARKISGTKPAEDFHLSRFACYLVAMNGDPRKPEIAAAQTYFAIRTREAETAPAMPTGPELLARAVLEAAEMIKAKDRVIGVLATKVGDDAPLVARARNHANGTGEKNRTQFFREIKQWAHAEHQITVKQEHVLEFLSTRKLNLFTRTDGQATAFAIEHGYAVNRQGTAGNGHNWTTGRLTPLGQAYAWERIVRFFEANGTLELPRQIGGVA